MTVQRLAFTLVQDASLSASKSESTSRSCSRTLPAEEMPEAIDIRSSSDADRKSNSEWAICEPVFSRRAGCETAASRGNTACASENGDTGISSVDGPSALLYMCDAGDDTREDVDELSVMERADMETGVSGAGESVRSCTICGVARADDDPRPRATERREMVEAGDDGIEGSKTTCVGLIGWYGRDALD